MSCIYRRCMCLAICLALGVLMAGSAMGEAAEVKSLFDESFWEELGLTTLSQCSAKSRAAIGNQVFSLQSDGSIYIYDAESGQYRYWTQGGAIPRTFVSQYSMLDEQTQQELDQAVFQLIPDEGAQEIYGYCATSGLIGRIDDEGIVWNDVPLDNRLMMERDQVYPESLQGAYIENGKMYALYLKGTDECVLLTFDLASGECTVHEAENVYLMCSYLPGSALLMCREADGRLCLKEYDWKNETRTDVDFPVSLHYLPFDNNLGRFAKRDAEVVERMEESGWADITRRIGGLTYDARSDRIAYVDTAGLWYGTKGQSPEWIPAEGEGWNELCYSDAQILGNGDYILNSPFCCLLPINQ